MMPANPQRTLNVRIGSDLHDRLDKKVAAMKKVGSFTKTDAVEAALTAWLTPEGSDTPARLDSCEARLQRLEDAVGLDVHDAA